MKACQLCGAEYSDRISYCFSDGEVLVAVKAAPATAQDPFDAPLPPNMRGTPAPTPVPDPETLARMEQEVEGVQPAVPPARPEPNDFTPRPLSPLEAGVREHTSAEPMYTPPVGTPVAPSVDAASSDDAGPVTPTPATPAEPPVLSPPPPTRSPIP